MHPCTLHLLFIGFQIVSRWSPLWHSWLWTPRNQIISDRKTIFHFYKYSEPQLQLLDLICLRVWGTHVSWSGRAPQIPPSPWIMWWYVETGERCWPFRLRQSLLVPLVLHCPSQSWSAGKVEELQPKFRAQTGQRPMDIKVLWELRGLFGRQLLEDFGIFALDTHPLHMWCMHEFHSVNYAGFLMTEKGLGHAE